MTASEIYELAEESDIAIPGLKQWNEDSGKRRVGAVLSRALGGADQVEVENYRMVFGHKDVWRQQYSDHKTLKCYGFERVGTAAKVTPNTLDDSDLIPF